MNKDLVVKGLIILILGSAILYFVFSGAFSFDRLIALAEFTVGVILIIFGSMFTAYVLVKRR